MKFIDKMPEKFKAFRVMDENGKIINKPYENVIPKEKLIQIFEKMVLLNEADIIFN